MVFEKLLLLLLLILATSLVLVVWRLMRGPGVADRALAFELILLHIAGMVALYAVVAGVRAMIDVVLIVAVAGFVSMVAVARYMEEGRH
jgi:multisubunit Na+/H+ antiporter MnhF subunit